MARKGHSHNHQNTAHHSESMATTQVTSDRKEDLDKAAESQIRDSAKTMNGLGNNKAHLDRAVERAIYNEGSNPHGVENGHGMDKHEDSLAVANDPEDLIKKKWAPGAPVTAHRPLNAAMDAAQSWSPTPNATLAMTKEAPQGDAQSNPWRGPDAEVSGKKYSGANIETRTVLQKHFDYFDFDNDGVIWPQDTWRGFREIGFNVLLSAFGAFIITVALAYPTSKFFPIPDPFFRIFTKNSHRARHGSDSGSYDSEGRFEPMKFEEIFSKYDQDGKGGLTKEEIWHMLSGNRVAMDPFGWVAGLLEWYATYLLVLPQDGVLRKEDARATIDGSIFYRKAEQYRAKTHKGPKVNTN